MTLCCGTLTHTCTICSNCSCAWLRIAISRRSRSSVVHWVTLPISCPSRLQPDSQTGQWNAASTRMQRYTSCCMFSGMTPNEHCPNHTSCCFCNLGVAVQEMQPRAMKALIGLLLHSAGKHTLPCPTPQFVRRCRLFKGVGSPGPITPVRT
jgi:hypothetical protein